MATTLEARNISLNASLQERSLPPPSAPFSNSPHVHSSPWWYPDGSPPRPTVPANNDDDHLLLLLLVLIPIAPFLLVVVCLRIYWFSNNTTTEDVTRDEVATAGRGLDKEVIESFPTMLYPEVKHFNLRRRGTLECAVCLSEFDDADALRLLPHCNHAFHPDCIDMWLGSHDTCPVCRVELTPSSAPPVAAAETPPVQVFVPVEEMVEPETMEEEEARVWAEEERERFTLRLPEEVRAGVVSRRMDREVGSSGLQEFEEGCEEMGELRLGEVGRMGYAEEDVVAAVVARGQRGRD